MTTHNDACTFPGCTFVGCKPRKCRMVQDPKTGRWELPQKYWTDAEDPEAGDPNCYTRHPDDR